MQYQVTPWTFGQTIVAQREAQRDRSLRREEQEALASYRDATIRLQEQGQVDARENALRSYMLSKQGLGLQREELDFRRDAHRGEVDFRESMNPMVSVPEGVGGDYLAPFAGREVRYGIYGQGLGAHEGSEHNAAMLDVARQNARTAASGASLGWARYHAELKALEEQKGLQDAFLEAGGYHSDTSRFEGVGETGRLGPNRPPLFQQAGPSGPPMALGLLARVMRIPQGHQVTPEEREVSYSATLDERHSRARDVLRDLPVQVRAQWLDTPEGQAYRRQIQETASHLATDRSLTTRQREDLLRRLDTQYERLFGQRFSDEVMRRQEQAGHAERLFQGAAADNDWATYLRALGQLNQSP